MSFVKLFFSAEDEEHRAGLECAGLRKECILFISVWVVFLFVFFVVFFLSKHF